MNELLKKILLGDKKLILYYNVLYIYNLIVKTGLNALFLIHSGG